MGEYLREELPFLDIHFGLPNQCDRDRIEIQEWLGVRENLADIFAPNEDRFGCFDFKELVDYVKLTREYKVFYDNIAPPGKKVNDHEFNLPKGMDRFLLDKY